MGPPEQTRAYRARLGLSFPMLSDPERQAYRAYRLGRLQLRREVNPSHVIALFRQSVRYGAAGSQGQDERQLGGYFVVDRDGTLLIAHPAEYVADVLDPDALLDTVRLTTGPPETPERPV
jgi:peroxiredoxin